MRYLLDRRQFVIARRPLAIDASWKARALADGWVLSYQDELALSERREPDGRTVLVLGNAYCLDALDDGGCGRYALLDWPHVTTDRGAATLAIFYGGEAGDRVVASSARLAAAVLRGESAGPLTPLPDIRQELRHPSLMGYLPSPGSRFREVRRLMRDQRLDVRTGVVDRLPSPLPPAASEREAADAVAGELTRFARELRDRTPGRIHLQLTAGLDSRTLLAAFHAAGLPFETVTFRTPFKPDEDAAVAGSLARALGVRHSVIDVQTPLDPGARQTYLLQTSGGINGADLKVLFPGDSYRFLEAGDAMVGGLGFEVGRQYFREAFGGLTLGTATGAEIWRRLAGEPGGELAGFLDRWLDWRRQDPYPFTLAASFYLDQRLGAWAATLMSGFDLLPGLTLHPATGSRIMAAMLSPEIEAQIDGRLQRDVIGALAPGLLRYPLNPVPLRRRIRSAVFRARRAARRTLRWG